MITIIYHSRDLDGYCSGAICKYKYPEAQLIGYDYGQPVPYDKLPEGRPVIMVDVSLPMPEMLKLAKHTRGKFTWIDHHQSAIKEYESLVSEIEEHEGVPFLAVLKNGIAACEITWQYLFPDLPMPQAVELLGKYDTWRNADQKEWETEILPFQYGMRLQCTSPETFGNEFFNNSLFNTVYPSVKFIGSTILHYQKTQNTYAAQRNAYEYNLKGYRAICINAQGIGSLGFESVYDAEKHDIMLAYQYNGKYWTFSLYTTHEHIDCSVIARIISPGGGGHKKAAGFQVNNLNEVFYE